MKMADITVKFNVDTSRSETLMEELHTFQYVPYSLGKSTLIQTTPPIFIHLQCKKIPGDTLEALMDIGGCTIRKGARGENSSISLDCDIYHQFNSSGMIFTTEGRAFDPSYSSLRLASSRWHLRRYKSAQYSGTEIDTMVSFRDKEWVLFPVDTEEVEEEDGQRVYTLPYEKDKKLIIDKGYLYVQKKKQEFKKGEKVIVTLQNAILKGTYNCDGVGQGSDAGMAYIDFDEQEREYLLVNTERVFHAE